MSRILLVLVLISQVATAQTFVKQYFSKEGITLDPEKSIYYRVGTKIPTGRKQKVKGDSMYIDSVWTFYTKTNRIHSRAFFKDGDLTGPYVFYHENGIIKEKGQYKDYNKDGFATFWDDEGDLKQTLEYFPDGTWIMGESDSFKVINYWDEGNNQLIKDGNGDCNCSFYESWPREKGKVSAGNRESIWNIISGDTLVAIEEYRKGRLLKGESTYQGRKFVYNKKFKQAEFPGGIQGLMKYLSKAIRYPAQAKRSSVEGKVFVRFNVDENGMISNFIVIKGVSKELNDEAIRVIKLMPNWTPAKSRGVPIKSFFVLPIYFKLDS